MNSASTTDQAVRTINKAIEAGEFLTADTACRALLAAIAHGQPEPQESLSPIASARFPELAPYVALASHAYDSTYLAPYIPPHVRTRHLAALGAFTRFAFGRNAFASMYIGWIQMAEYHRRIYGSGIGQDYFAAPLWYAVGEALRDMLNLDIGPFDCGSLDQVIHDTLQAEGWTEDWKARAAEGEGGGRGEGGTR